MEYRIDFWDNLSENLCMAALTPKGRYNAEFSQRLRRMRAARGLTQEQMARGLGIRTDAYRKYEDRSPMPLFLLEQLAIITGRDLHYIITGKQRRGPPNGDNATSHFGD